ncbi:MAG TPA: hypothetical protein ACFYD3_02485 [Candidatus Hypogeohydataceae bacterium YC41]
MGITPILKQIDCIISFKNKIEKLDPKTKITNKLLSEIGELYVICELEKKGYHCNRKGGQASFDIYIQDLDKRIEVKTSLLGNEYSEKIRYCGWVVKRRNQKKENKFDTMVCVALDYTFTKPKFYIFTHAEAFSVDDVKSRRFKNDQKKIHIFENRESYKNAIKSEPDYVTKYERYINEHPSKFLDKWDKIKQNRP